MSVFSKTRIFIDNSNTYITRLIRMLRCNHSTTFFESSARENGWDGKSIERWFGLQKEACSVHSIAIVFIKKTLYTLSSSVCISCMSSTFKWAGGIKNVLKSLHQFVLTCYNFCCGNSRFRKKKHNKHLGLESWHTLWSYSSGNHLRHGQFWLVFQSAVLGLNTLKCSSTILNLEISTK